jgi:hypothetical protein
MRLVVECINENRFELWDPDALTETEFELTVARSLSCIYPAHVCVMFSGGFRYDDRIYHPDMALIAKDFSHWFIVEVELVTHSFQNHILPQVRSFQYGEPQSDCVSSLVKSNVLNAQQAETLISFVPRNVAVITNKWNADWYLGLSALQIQLLSISVFRSNEGREAVEVNRRLETFMTHLGFGKYVAVDRSLIFPKDLSIPDGEIQINDPAGSIGTWMIRRDSKFAWIEKTSGTPDFPDDCYIQLIRTIDGGFSFRRPNLRGRMHRE